MLDLSRLNSSDLAGALADLMIHLRATDGVDCTWMLRSAFAVLSMQSGFALLETGCVSAKNVLNLKVKNVIDLALGGLSYWLFGYAFTFGRDSRGFLGLTHFAMNDLGEEMGREYTNYFFQFTFASTATTIVSGAVAERITMKAYMLFSFANIFPYAVSAHWSWARKVGWLHVLGFYDFAGEAFSLECFSLIFVILFNSPYFFQCPCCVLYSRLANNKTTTKLR